MMKWIDQTLFDDLVLANSDQTERIIRDIQPFLTEVLPFISDAVLQYRIYHDETEHTNSLESVRVCFVRNAILFSVSKQTYPKITYRIFCCNDDDLQHTDNYSRTKAHEGLVEPQCIGKLSKRKVEEWVEYQTQYYRNLVCIDKENDRSIREHIARLERIPDVLWSGTGNPERSNAMVSVIRSRSSARVFPKTSGCRASAIRSMTFWKWHGRMNRRPNRRISLAKTSQDMKRFEVKVRYTFDGHYVVRAVSETDAARMVSHQCGLTLGGGIHTALGVTACPDWEFPIHPDMRILSIKDKSDGTL